MIVSETMIRAYREVFLNTPQGNAVLANLLDYLGFFRQSGPDEHDRRNTAIFILKMCGVIVEPSEHNDGTIMEVVEALGKVNGVLKLPEVNEESEI
jgi:hypothetical protein